MSRRTTLGPMSPSQINSRSTGLAGRVGIKEPRTAGKVTSGRPSILPTALMSVDRRSSAYGKTSGVKQDPRPLGDKNYFQSCLRTVITYLSANNYPHAISPKTLTTPTAKEFANIVQFLFQKFDPTLKALGKIEDEVPLFFKRLNYPFQISKSALFAVGSPHSWPAVLAALTWLVELLNYEDKADAAQPSNFDDKQRAEREFYSYVSTSYKFFLAGDDARCQAADDEVLAHARVREEQVLAEVEALKQAGAALQVEHDALRTAPAPLLAAQTKRSEHLSDQDKFGKLLDNLVAVKGSLQRKLAERSADLAAKREQLAAVTRENQELQARIGAQTINRADINRMHNERSKQKEILESVSVQRENMDRRVFEQEVQVERALEGLEAAVGAYNSQADRLALIPASAKRAEGVVYEVCVNRAAGSAGDLISVDLKGTVKAGLERLREVYRTKARQLGADLLALQEQLDSRRDMAAERSDDIAALEGQVRKLEAQHRAAKERLESEVRATSEAAEKIQGEVASMRCVVSASLADSEDKVRQAQAQYEALQRAYEAEVARLQKDLSAAMEAMLHHRMALRAVLERTHGEVTHVLGAQAGWGA